MIHERVIVHREKTQVYQFPGAQRAEELERNKYRPSSPLLSQQEYNEWLNTVPLHVGDFITFNITPVSSLNVVHYIAEVETDFALAAPAYHFSPKAFLLVQVEYVVLAGVGPWVRWSDIDGYRRVSGDEITNITDKSIDTLQRDCVERARAYLQDARNARKTR